MTMIIEWVLVIIIQGMPAALRSFEDRESCMRELERRNNSAYECWIQTNEGLKREEQ